MKHTSALVIVLLSIPACSKTEDKTSLPEGTPIDAETLLIFVDARPVAHNYVIVVHGRRAFGQQTPFRSADPPSQRVLAESLPEALRYEAIRWAKKTGDKGPFKPGGAPMSIGRLDPGASQVVWEHFDNSHTDLAEFLARLRDSVVSSGRRVDTVPDWVNTTAATKVLRNTTEAVHVEETD